MTTNVIKEFMNVTLVPILDQGCTDIQSTSTEESPLSENE